MAPQQQPQPGEPYVLGDGEEVGGAAGSTAPDGGRGAEEAASQGAGQGDEAQDGAGNGEIWAAERQAHRAAAVAVSEGFHPLRLRPYVAEPGGEPGETTVRPLITPDGDGPATTDLGLFPAMYAGLEYPQEPEEAGEAAYVDLSAVVGGRHRRRRRGFVITAAAVAASALAAGAVAVTGQVLSDEPGRTDRALPDRGMSMPDVTLPDDMAPATGKAAPAITHRPAPATTSPTPSASPSVTPATTPPPSAAPTVTPAPTVTAGGTVAPLPDPTTSAPTPTPTPTPPSESPVAPEDDPVLQVGDSGPAVADLQRRLALVWIYHRRADGTFDRDVAEAVTTFQTWYGVRGDPAGVYGPNTRAALEHRTSSHD